MSLTHQPKRVYSEILDLGLRIQGIELLLDPWQEMLIVRVVFEHSQILADSSEPRTVNPAVLQCALINQTVRKLDARLRTVAQRTDFRDFFCSARLHAAKFGHRATCCAGFFHTAEYNRRGRFPPEMHATKFGVVAYSQRERSWINTLHWTSRSRRPLFVS